jgi:cyclopropane fatty-acyl-phospholipid synthase-like methyltransferase
MTQIPASSPDFTAVADYFNGWERYQQVIKHNYMEHIEIDRVLHQYLAARASNPFSILDLGCGDASFSARLLANLSPHTYTGVDLSVTALELASHNLAALKIPIALKQQELQAFLSSSTDRFDVILSSFSIHHLDSDRKQTYLAQVKQHLNPDGVLLLVDVFRQEGESRQEYIDRYSNNIYRDWIELNLEVQQSLIRHIVDSDYPEWESSINKWSIAAGFKNIDLLYQDAHNTQKILAIS